MNLPDLPDFVSLEEIAPGCPILKIRSSRANADISLYGGQVLSFRPVHTEQDVLFLSRRAMFRNGTAIRGGIPICWPWFGNDPENRNRPSHGFARTSNWRLAEIRSEPDSSVILSLHLNDTQESLAVWPAAFRLELNISVSTELKLELVSRNESSVPMMITQALHSYFRVSAAEKTEIIGLEGCEYIDKLDQGRVKYQKAVLYPKGGFDRIYSISNSAVTISDSGFRRRIEVKSSGSRSIVAWNPWKEKSGAIRDLKNADYQHFVCLETANAGHDSVSILPGQCHRLQTIIAVIVPE